MMIMMMMIDDDDYDDDVNGTVHTVEQFCIDY